MRRSRLDDVAARLGGRLIGPSGWASGVITDSRLASRETLFFALRGQRSDGHDHAAEALGRGSSAVVVEEGRVQLEPRIEVRDPLAALAGLAATERSASSAHVVAITGSTGKTTTKDLLVSILSLAGPTHASPESFNNHVGVPTTLLGAASDPAFFVCEMGAGAEGEIADYCRIARPDSGIVTNVGQAHLATFGSVDSIARAKREVVEALADDGLAVLNRDDPRVIAFSRGLRSRIVTFGRSRAADVRATCVRLGADARARFTLVTRQGAVPVVLPLPGAHMVPNALAASAAALGLGLTPVQCAEGLRAAKTSRWRMQRSVTPSGVRLLNDAYNSSPPSARAALTTARLMAGSGRLIAVIGEMAQLGPESAREHRSLGRFASELPVDRLITVGASARAIWSVATDRGIAASHSEDLDGVDATLEAMCRPGDVVVLKASRSAGFERIAAALS
ncbi:MAG: UDP-N-acetylmuramoyl-tripeptide--D-alanyl-D-alanine ligase [Actinomycetota bacterium]